MDIESMIMDKILTIIIIWYSVGFFIISWWMFMRAWKQFQRRIKRVFGE